MISHMVISYVLPVALWTATPDAPEPTSASLALDPVAAFVAAPAPLLQDEKPSGFSWSYIEANYIWLEPQTGGQNFDGWEVKASLEIFFNLFLQGSYSKLSDQSDLDLYRIGLGWHLPVGDSLDLYGLLSYASTKLDDVTDVDEDGVVADVGARFWLTPKLELNGEAEWADIDESDFGIGIGARWYFMNRFSFGLGVKTLDSDETYNAGLRFSF